MMNSADYVITIVDDHSSDNTATICKKLEATYPFINYIRQKECKGVGNSRNKGISSVESLFVILLDADDKVGSRYLQEAEKHLRMGQDIINPDAILFGDKKTRWEVPEKVTIPMILEKNQVHTCAAFRRSFWEKVGGIDESMEYWQDYEFWIRMLNAGAKIMKLEGDHFYYRKHGTSKSIYSIRNREITLHYIKRKHEKLFQRVGLALPKHTLIP
jgi:glycosyltransferase involved in cell wall biosynthesis